MKKTFTTIAFGLLSISLSAQIPVNGLKAHYQFNGNANDNSGNGNNGVVSGATLTSDRFGNANSAYLFNGINNKITLTNANLSLPDSFSVSSWVSINNLSPSNYDAPIISQWNGTTSGTRKFAVGYRRINTQIGMSLYLCNASNTQFDYYPINWNPQVSTWYHFVTIFKPGVYVKTYVNGVLHYSSTTSIPAILTTPTNPQIEIGHMVASLGNYWFNGSIDDIRIYDRILNQTEISTLYNENICYQNITVTDTLLINTNITGFNPVTYKNTIKVWPNPTNDHITIDNGNLANITGYQIKITNSLSQQVFQSAITQQQFYVDLSTWTGNGIYFVHIIDGQGNTIDIKKIVLQ